MQSEFAMCFSKNNLPRLHQKKWLIRSTHLLSLSIPCHDNSMSNSMEIPKLFLTILTIRTPMLFCLSVLPVSPPRGSLKFGGYDFETKSERMALNLHVSPVYASGCILFKLSVDPLCLMQSYSVVPNNPDFSSCSYDIAVISNAISCAYELRIPLSSAFTATHSRF